MDLNKAIHVHLCQDSLKEIGLKACVLESYINDFWLMTNSCVFDQDYYFQKYIKDGELIQQNGSWFIKLRSTETITKELGLSTNTQKTAFKKIKFKTIVLNSERYLWMRRV